MRPDSRSAPDATYRLQLGDDLDFSAASDLVPQLAALGVTHLYLSPIFEAAPGSTHGYDVADPRHVAGRLGGEDGLRRLSDVAAEHGLGIVVDVVPNHMAAHTANPHWRALLAEGRSGSAGDVFDVTWRTPLPQLEDKVVVPVLGDVYGRVLERGEIEVTDEGGEVVVRYFDHRFPLSPESLEAVERAGGPSVFAGTAGNASSFDRLHALLESQHYRLVHWRLGDRIVNYRRFFTITDLAAARVEDPDIFDLVHDTVLRLHDEGVIHGLRIDHPDGLRDPGRYFSRLAERTGGAWTVAEKITHPGEPLPDWPVAGTTGYEFCNDVLGVLAVDPAGQAGMDALDERLGGGGSYAEAARVGKRDILHTGLATDVNRLARLLLVVTQQRREVRDTDLDLCRDAIAGIVEGIEVYRPYVDPQTLSASAQDRAVIESAVAHAVEGEAAPAWLLEFTGRLLLGEEGDGPEHVELVARFPQLSSAAVAKGTEDTAFYRYRRFLAVNEVGGDPGRFGLDVAAFHETAAERARRHPTAMLTTATHDTKRGEDTRLRMAALSEFADDWVAAAASWASVLPAGVDGQMATLAWQTMVGIWPLRGEPDGAWRDRVVAYLVKAEREAGQRTTWIDPSIDVEDALAGLVDACLADSDFRATFEPLAERAAETAMVTGLSQVLLRCTSPGVPDTYQGMELWDDHLVDPDNRRPVDWGARRGALTAAEHADPASLWQRRRDGSVKAFVLSRALRLRSERRDCFGADGGYEPVTATGQYGDRVLAFSRTGAQARVVSVATRLPGPLLERGDAIGAVWGDTTVTLPPGRYTDRLTGAGFEGGDGVAVSEVLSSLPVALLVSG